MSISYSIDQQRRVIVEVWAGKITRVELRRFWKAFLTDPSVLRLRKSLVDMRQCELAFSGSDLVDEATLSIGPIMDSRTWRTAFVVADSVQHGVCRQFLGYFPDFSQGEVFREPDEALDWLLKSPTDSAPDIGSPD